MNGIWEKKWKSVFIWISAYLNFIAFALVGGYVLVKSDDEELKHTAKSALLITVIFAALSAILSLYNYIGGFFNGYYSSNAYEVYSVINSLVGISRIVVYAVLVVWSLVKKDEADKIED